MNEDFEKAVEERRAKKIARPRKKSVSTISDAKWQSAIDDVKIFGAEGEWEGATSIHFVAANTLLFEKVYGFAPLDMTPKTRLVACVMASKLYKEVFEESVEKMVLYLRWVWEREDGREKWRKANDKGGQTISWGLVFGRRLLNEYANDTRRNAQKR